MILPRWGNGHYFAESVSGAMSQRGIGANDVIVHCLMELLFELASIIVIFVPCNPGFERFQPLHGQEDCAVVGDQEDTMHAKARARQIDNRDFLPAGSFFADIGRNAHRITPELSRKILRSTVAHSIALHVFDSRRQVKSSNMDQSNIIASKM